MTPLFRIPFEPEWRQDIDKFRIMTYRQHDFRKGKSMQSATYNFTECVYKLRDNDKHVAGIFFDKHSTALIFLTK